MATTAPPAATAPDAPTATATPVPTPAVPAPPPAPLKSSLLSAELYVLAAVETALYTQGLIPATGTWSKIAAMVAIMLGAAGFAVVRGNTKIAAIQAGLPQTRAFSISAASLKAKLAAVAASP